MHAGLVGLKPNPTKSGHQHAAGWERCGDDVVHQPVEDDAAPGQLIRGQGKCAIGLLD
jgi:hypothetical protein